jgi:ABC-type transport system involved in cytochrome bd biosynthesis fused ATPase/permease subunit
LSPLISELLVNFNFDMADSPSIEVQNLSYKFQDGSNGLENVILSLPPGSRTLLIGGMSYYSITTLPMRNA